MMLNTLACITTGAFLAWLFTRPRTPPPAVMVNVSCNDAQFMDGYRGWDNYEDEPE